MTAATIVTVAALAFWMIPEERGVDHVAVLVSIVASTLTLVVLYQRRQLEEARLFKELFTDFNQRYDRLNSDLNQILALSDGMPLTPEHTDTLFDYFNLCAEEYMFYRMGHIREDAWQSWIRGMKRFYKSPRIRALWDQELAEGSYYGFQGSRLLSD